MGLATIVSKDLKKDAQAEVVKYAVKANKIFKKNKEEEGYNLDLGIREGARIAVAKGIAKELGNKKCQILATTSKDKRAEHEAYVGRIVSVDKAINGIGIGIDYGCKHGLKIIGG